MRAAEGRATVGGMSSSIIRALAALLAVAAGTLGLAACGGSGNGKPSYCADQAKLQSEVKQLASVDVVNGGLDAVKAQLTKIESSAQALADSAKKDFPTQTDALTSSVNALKTSSSGISGTPSAAAIAGVAANVAAVVQAVKGFTDAVASKC